MATAEDTTSEPSLRFKRRKIAHPRRAQPHVPSEPGSASPNTGTHEDTNQAAHAHEDDESAPSLKEILRARKRPRDRLREATHRAEARSQALVHASAPQQDTYANRFVAQTGQVVDRDDKQMTEYIEARLAEQNHRKYGWPIPKHLEAAVAALASEHERPTSAEPVDTGRSRIPMLDKAASIPTVGAADRSGRVAAGMGKLQEVDLGPDATTRNIERTEAAFRRLEGGEPAEEQPARRVRLGRDGKPRRPPKRKNSNDLRRDQMVEAVLREAKLEYFEEDAPTSPPPNGDAGNDDAMVEKFRQEFLESVESRQQRKPAPPPGPKGVKEVPKGPKLGGSRSARAAMRLQEEQAAKNKR